MPLSRNQIDRRRLLRLGALTTGAAVSCRPARESQHPGSGPPEMRYRSLGNTGLKVSEISFGTQGFDNPALLRTALDAGINTVFTSGSYLDGMAEELLGMALAGMGRRRDELVLFSGETLRPGTTKQTILDAIDASLRRLRTDRLEFFCTFEVRTPADLRADELFEAFEVARRAGKVLHLGLSGHHGGMRSCLNAAIEDGHFELFFIKYDFASYPDQDEILRRAAQRGIGTIVFKTSAGNRQREIADLEKDGLSFPQATVKWALSNPDVASVCVTITNFAQIRSFAGAVAARLTSPEMDMLRRYSGEMYRRYCRFCGTCEASCPSQVAVADINRYNMYFTYYGREKDAMNRYRTLSPQRSAATCAQCPGTCEGACPFGRPVRAELVEAHRRLSVWPA